MSNYLTEEQQIDAIKKWWKQYGNWLTNALLAIALIYAAWYWYQQRNENIQVQASQLYEQLLTQLAAGDDSQVALFAKQLTEEYSASTYADFARLSLARQAVYSTELTEARQHLTQVAEYSKHAVLRQLAKIRLARVLSEEKAYVEALAAIEKVDDQSYLPMILELRGDIYQLQGDTKRARIAYQQALEQLPRIGITSPLLSMKLHSLPAESVS